MRKLLGGAMIATPFVLMFLAAGAKIGYGVVAGAFLSAFGLAGWIWAGVVLLMPRER